MADLAWLLDKKRWAMEVTLIRAKETYLCVGLFLILFQANQIKGTI